MGRPYKSGLQVYNQQIFTHQSLSLYQSKPASIAPGSVNEVTALVGWATSGAGGRVAVGMLTNCSLMNSFNLFMRISEHSAKLQVSRVHKSTKFQ